MLGVRRAPAWHAILRVPRINRRGGDPNPVIPHPRLRLLIRGVLPPDGMLDRPANRTENRPRISRPEISDYTHAATRKPRNRPTKLIECVPHERDFFRIVGQQLRSDPVYRGRIITAKQEAKTQRFRRERSIPLPRDNCIHDMHDPPLDLFAHRSIRPAVKKHAIQIQARPPNRVIP